MAQQQLQDRIAIRQCTGCGAAVEMNHTALSTQCTYCEAPMVDSQRAAEGIDRVAPFRVTRELADVRLREFLRGKFWAPGPVKSLRFGGRGLRGVLVPHWGFTGVVRSTYRARVGIYWYRNESYTDGSGKRRTRRKRETEWFNLSGTAARHIEDHLVSASVGLQEAESNALEPFDLGWAVPFDPRLIAGFEAELPSISRHHAGSTAASELRAEEAPRIAKELLPGDTNRVTDIRSEVAVERHQVIVLPVWIGTYQYKSRARRLLVNGQTGHIVGKVPISARKVAVAAGLVALVVAAVVLVMTMVPR